MSISPQFLDDCYGALLPTQGLPPKIIVERVGYGAIVSVRHALRQLVDDGRATFTGPDCSRLYRKVQR